jgi:hypothetical protein
MDNDSAIKMEFNESTDNIYWTSNKSLKCYLMTPYIFLFSLADIKRDIVIVE